MAPVRLPRLHVHRIVDTFGNGAVGLVEACRSVGFHLTLSSVRKWLVRDRIPMDGWLMVSKTHEIKRGKPLDLNSFVSTL